MSIRKSVEPSTEAWLSNSTITRSILLTAIASEKKGPQDLFFSPSTSNPVSKHFIENIVLRVCVALTRTKNAKKEKALIYKNNVVWPVEVAERKSE